MEFVTRQGTNEDKDWLYQLYCSTMRMYVELTWGWDEEFQRHGFQTNLHPTKFRIVVIGQDSEGAYLVNEEDDHYWIEMLLVSKKVQRKGLGSAIIKELQAESVRTGKPLRLSVIKANPAKEFYRRLGFYAYDQDESFIKMKWAYNKPVH